MYFFEQIRDGIIDNLYAWKKMLTQPLQSLCHLYDALSHPQRTLTAFGLAFYQAPVRVGTNIALGYGQGMLLGEVLRGIQLANGTPMVPSPEIELVNAASMTETAAACGRQPLCLPLFRNVVLGGAARNPCTVSTTLTTALLRNGTTTIRSGI